MSPPRLPILLVGLLLGLAACGAQPTTPGVLLPPASATPAVPASAVPGLVTATPIATAIPSDVPTLDAAQMTATPLLEAAAATATATLTPEGPCTNNAHFLADVTVPDGAQFQPGQPIDKQWRVVNSGTCEWSADYRLVLVSGNGLNARGEAALYPAKPGVEAIFAVAMVAPQAPGKYTGRWQARDPNGKLFGDRIFITIEVLAPTPAETETATPTP